MKCKKCDSDVAEEAIFCHRCGASLESGGAGAAPAAGSKERSAMERGAAASLERATSNRAADPPESVIWEGGYSPVAMAGSWAGAVVLTIVVIIAAIFLWNALHPWGWLLLAAAGLLWLYLGLRLLYYRLSVRYKLTNQRFFHERGILRRVTNRIEVIDIDDIAFEQSIVDRMFGTGRIKISSSDRTDPMLWLEGIDDVKTVASQIDEARRAERMRRGLYVESI